MARREPIPFEIEEHVVRRRSGQLREAVLGTERLDDLVLRRFELARSELDRSLVANLDQCLAGAARGPGHVVQLAEPLESVDLEAP